jgi:HD-GYP domain-containing protein (c-di-GMP phosphodiesterase class II)
MPILTSLADLKPGMCLSSNIVNKYSVLLPKGHELTEKDIATLANLIPNQDVHVFDPDLDGIVDFEDVSHAQTVSRIVREKSTTVIDKVAMVVRSGKSLSHGNVVEMKKTIRDSIRYLTENSVTMALVEQSKNWENYLQEHSSNVFYLSLLIGNKVGNYIKNERERLSAASYVHNWTDLTPLGTAALFHDIGMVPLSYLYHKDGILTETEKEMLRLHPHTGANMLPDSISPMVRLSVRDHHENYKGTGYPDGLPGESVGIFSRVIRIADAYCSATADRAGYKGRLEALVLYEMLYGECRQFYDPELLAVFGSLMPPFPIGAKLELQDGRYAVVVRHNEKSPFQPQVIIAFADFNTQLPKNEIEPPFYMGDRKNVKISSFAGEDLSFLNESVYDIPSEPKYDKVLNFSYP